MADPLLFEAPDLKAEARRPTYSSSYITGYYRLPYALNVLEKKTPRSLTRGASEKNSVSQI